MPVSLEGKNNFNFSNAKRSPLGFMPIYTPSDQDQNIDKPVS